uniref:NADH dehydrogenase subunit 4L n=1 Tax=Chorda asiatica TaxID=1281577 RepID=A0A8F0FDG8_9PHAE|nr:NADH dehydrogenase subunit 4L [Chorda asiatica]QWK44411.1 NADH dehydrogenase subunit 4L [Chorda asiatica]WBP69772.1 NADH dehydrogenase subunit 4L [Chorda asiatica]
MDFISFFFVAVMLFVIGVGGVILNRTNIVVVLMSLELALLSVSLNFLIFSVCLGDLMGQIFAIFILIIAACETSVGLAIILVYFRVRGSIRIDQASLLKS